MYSTQIQYPGGGQRYAHCLVNKTSGRPLASVARFERINGNKLRRQKKLSEIRELSYANYGRIVARLTPIREGTRFALSVSPRFQPLGVSRVTHKRFLFFFSAFAVISSN